MSSANPYSASAQPTSSYNLQSTSRTMRIKTVDPMSVGKMLGALYVFLGAIVGIFTGIFGLIGATAGGNGNAGGIVVAGAMVIFMPLIYGVMGFVGGALSAVLYNFFARFVGGVEFEVEG